VRCRGYHILYTFDSEMAVKKGKAIPVTGRGGRQVGGMLRLPHFLYNGLTDGCEIISLTRRPPFTLKKIPGTHFF
jgi:hypothetical protein